MSDGVIGAYSLGLSNVNNISKSVECSVTRIEPQRGTMLMNEEERVYILFIGLPKYSLPFA